MYICVQIYSYNKFTAITQFKWLKKYQIHHNNVYLRSKLALECFPFIAKIGKVWTYLWARVWLHPDRHHPSISQRQRLLDCHFPCEGPRERARHLWGRRGKRRWECVMTVEEEEKGEVDGRSQNGEIEKRQMWLYSYEMDYEVQRRKIIVWSILSESQINFKPST